MLLLLLPLPLLLPLLLLRLLVQLQQVKRLADKVAREKRRQANPNFQSRVAALDVDRQARLIMVACIVVSCTWLQQQHRRCDTPGT